MNTKYSSTGWESSDFPVLCQVCLGPNPSVRMQKTPFGAECGVCKRPFTVFRWRPGTTAEARFKKTQVCQSCAKLKNVCQCCILDLQYNLPVAIRDKIISSHVDEHHRHQSNGNSADNSSSSSSSSSNALVVPTSTTNRQLLLSSAAPFSSDSGKATGKEAILRSLTKDQPYFARNKPFVCGYWLKGKCTRGEYCPFRHDQDATAASSSTSPSSSSVRNQDREQNIASRYFGTSGDMDAARRYQKILERGLIPTPPEDPTITSLCISNAASTDLQSEELWRGKFAEFGQVANVKIIPNKQLVFVQFADRESAENAAAHVCGVVDVLGKPVRIGWARPRGDAGKTRYANTSSANKHIQMQQQHQQQQQQQSERKQQVSAEVPTTKSAPLKYASLDPANLVNE
eukprot:ANDGO_02638.mRNA.1 Zinc finger CCCH domain-containing protein 4